MNRKKHKNILLLLLTITLFFSLIPNPSFAHKSTCVKGSESKGYIVMCHSHAGTKNIYYRDNLLNFNEYNVATLNGLNAWNNTSIVNIKYSGSSSSTISAKGSFDTSTAAIAENYNNTSTGHVIRFHIVYNTNVMQNYSATKKARVAAHELGHAIGLDDLNESYNISKLMYGTMAGTQTIPTATDKTGAKEAVK